MLPESFIGQLSETLFQKDELNLESQEARALLLQSQG